MHQSLDAEQPELVKAYFQRLGWTLRNSDELSDFVPPGTWWLTKDGSGLLADWVGFDRLDDLIRDWADTGPTLLHWDFVRQTMERLYEFGGPAIRTDIRNWVDTGGRYPPAVAAEIILWRRPVDWLEQVAQLSPDNVSLMPDGGEIDVLRNDLREFMVRQAGAQLDGRIPASQCLLRGHRRL